MRNCVILGSGRSGTSLTAGMLHGAGYHCGPDLLPPTPGNPSGYFESRVIEGLNEAILASVTRHRPERWPEDRVGPGFTYGQRWLAAPRRSARLQAPDGFEDDVARLCATQPFAFKDPRFSFTLPLWRPLLGDTRFVVVFRDPATTVSSILREHASEEYLALFRLTPRRAHRSWQAHYRHILDIHAETGDWLYLLYDQLFTSDGQERLRSFLDTDLDLQFIDPTLRRSNPKTAAPRAARRTYAELLRRAGMTGDH